MKNMNMKLFNIVFFNIVINTTMSLKIYQSNVEFLNTKMVAGLTYERAVLQNQFLSNNFTMCIRTSIKIAAPNKSAMLLLIGNSKSKAFLILYARYPETWFHFGNPNLVSWILRNPQMYSYRIWKLDTWNHMCFSYSESNSYISFIKVGKNL